MLKNLEIKNNRSKKTYKICIIALIALIVFLQTCKGDKLTKPDSEVATFVKTTYIEGKADTVYIPVSKPYRVEVPIVVYVDRPDSIDTTKVFRYYHSPFEDSLVVGIIHTKIDIDSATLAWQDFTYTPKFPKYITRVDTVKIDSTAIITQFEEPKVKVFVGIGVGGNPNTFQLGPQVSILSKKELMYTYQYDLLNKTHNIGFSVKLKNPFKRN